MSHSLPTLSTIANSPSHAESPLAKALSVLFEPSPILISTLEPQLAAALIGTQLSSYSELIDAVLASIDSWDILAQSEFIAGHPRIGESKKLSSLSAKEQGTTGTIPTPPEVLARLAHLNSCYESRYPGLRYITFVNGRSRLEIAEEMEDVLEFEHSLSPNEPPLEILERKEIGGNMWSSELRRAVRDVGRIAKSRLKTLGVK